MVTAVGTGATAGRATAAGPWASEMCGARRRFAPCVMSCRWSCGHRSRERIERAAAGPADQHLRRAGDKGRHRQRTTVLAMRGVVSMGEREAHLPLERREWQV